MAFSAISMIDVKSKLVQATTEIQIALPVQPSDEQARSFLSRYSAAIEGNFIAWMGAAALTARSIQGRYAAEENLWVEIKDDHAGMLHSFIKSTHAEPGSDDYAAIELAVADIRNLLGSMSGLKNLTLMAVLENTSTTFIPLLAKLAKQLGSTNLAYTNVHGEADIAHADQFTWAVEHEMTHHENAEQKIDEAIATSINLLRTIFSENAK